MMISAESQNPMLSIVIPVYNEEPNLTRLYQQLKMTLDTLPDSWEAIFVDDASQDNSWAILCALHEQDKRVRILRFRRNYGQTAGLSAGFDHARGQYIITMDADLQNDPADIPMLLEKMHSGGYDVVSGWRKDR